MGEREAIDGVAVTEEQIAAWAAEAEAGYDVEALKKRGRGRPGRGAEPSQVVALRLTLDEITALDARASGEGKTRSEIIREALSTASRLAGLLPPIDDGAFFDSLPDEELQAWEDGPAA